MCRLVIICEKLCIIYCMNVLFVCVFIIYVHMCTYILCQLYNYVRKMLCVVYYIIIFSMVMFFYCLNIILFQ